LAALPELAGIWTVVGHRFPGISALGEAEAGAWHGRTLRLTRNEALSATGERCATPGYAVQTQSATQSPVLEVSCEGREWLVPGARLTGTGADRAEFLWDGVVFELARDQDFRARGQEPGWLLDITTGREIRFAHDYGQDVLTAPAPAAIIDAATGRTEYRAASAGHDLRVVIERQRCEDTMSGQPFAATVTVTLDGKAYAGCGGESLGEPAQ
jgi:uncharacterized membrane protein